jgi:hypothetical protein
MKLKYIIYGVLGLSLIVGYNVWLVQRDNILFEAYGRPQQEVWR